MAFLSRLGSFLRRLSEAPFAMSLAMAGVLNGLRGVLNPDTTPLHIVLGAWSYAWSVAYAVGGLGLLYGKGMNSPKPEASGAVLFGFGALAQAAATAAFVDRTPLLSVYSVVILVLFGVAGFFHAHNVVRLSAGGP